MKQALEHITDNIQEYRQMEVLEGERLNHLLQQITGTLFYLETIRSNFHHDYQSKVQECILGGDSVARATNKADVSIPEMYLLRHIMKSAYTCVDAIRSNISWLKSEKQNSN